MKDLVYNVETKQFTEVEVSFEEQERRKQDLQKAEEEANKPLPPSEMDLLNERLSLLQKAFDEFTLGV